MKISELFYSLQGEGKRIGYPSFFIRTNLCNLRCKFTGGNLCDTPYTSWDFKNPENIGDMEYDGIISEYKKYTPDDIVITGGEPTIQGKELSLLCKKIKEHFSEVFITLETNGTFIGDYSEYIDLISISPKLKTSIPFNTEFEKTHDKNRINYNTLKTYQELYNKGRFDIQWKFVITSDDDIEEIKELQNEIGIYNKDIFLMPEGVTESELLLRRKPVAELCKKYHFNYTDRLHILLWGSKRGV